MIINDRCIIFNTFNLKEKYLLLRLILFDLMADEPMHLLRKMVLGDVWSELALLSPNEGGALTLIKFLSRWIK